MSRIVSRYASLAATHEIHVSTYRYRHIEFENKTRSAVIVKESNFRFYRDIESLIRRRYVN